MKLIKENFKYNKQLIYVDFDLISYTILNRVNEYEVYYKVKRLIFDKISGPVWFEVKNRIDVRVRENIKK